MLKFVLCLWLISMVTVCCLPLSPDLVFQLPPVPNSNPTYVVSWCTFSSFQSFQTPLQLCLHSHVMSPCIPPFGSLRVCVNWLPAYIYKQWGATGLHSVAHSPLQCSTVPWSELALALTTAAVIALAVACTLALNQTSLLPVVPVVSSM